MTNKTNRSTESILSSDSSIAEEGMIAESPLD